MKLNIKIILISSYIFTININANGPLQLKGFHKDLSFTQACKTMSSFKSNRGDFILDKEDKKCGFGRKGTISYPYIIGASTSNKVKEILLSPDVVNSLFDSENITRKKFSKEFLKKYSWINKFETKYSEENKEYGWKLSIKRKNWIKIEFIANK